MLKIKPSDVLRFLGAYCEAMSNAHRVNTSRVK